MVGLGLFILTTYLATLSIAAATKPTIVAEDDVDLERIAGFFLYIFFCLYLL